MLLSVTPDWAPNMSSMADLSQLILLNNESIPASSQNKNHFNKYSFWKVNYNQYVIPN